MTFRWGYTKWAPSITNVKTTKRRPKFRDGAECQEEHMAWRESRHYVGHYCITRKRKREREKETKRQRDKETKRQREKERKREREKERKREREK